MADAQRREVLITGVGLLSGLGEGSDAHWQALNSGRTTADAVSFAPMVVHPLGPVDFDKQIPKKGDQRQMEPWQRIGTYAAGLALDDAGVKGNADILARMDMIVAAGGGERDIAVDGTIMSGYAGSNAPGVFLNERLMNDLRPTLFLAQLSNLLAGNISIVHGVAGSSRTFMGEEAAGFDAVRIAHARVASGQSDIMLVGGAHNGERKELLLLYEFGGYNLKHAFAPVWDRGPRGGFALGSFGAFLVLEGADHARARNARPIARLGATQVDRANRASDTTTAALQRLWDRVSAETAVDRRHAAVISGATGAAPATAEERDFLARAALPVRATATRLGHGMEAHFPMNIALAALAVKHGKLFPPDDGEGFERPMDGSLVQAVVTGVGHWRGEAMALVERAA